MALLNSADDLARLLTGAAKAADATSELAKIGVDDFAKAVLKGGDKLDDILDSNKALAKILKRVEDANPGAIRNLQQAERATAALAKKTAQQETKAAAVFGDTVGAAKPSSKLTQLAQKVLINRQKLAFFTVTGSAGLIIAEYTTKGGLSTWAAERSIDIADGLEDISPELAAKFREFGIDGVMFAADVAGTQQAAGVNYIAEILDKEGRHTESVAVRVGFVTLNPLVYAEMMLAEKGERAETFIQRLEDAKVSREDLTNYLNNHPNQRAMVEDRLGVELKESLPNLMVSTSMEEKNNSKENIIAVTANKAKEKVTDPFNDAVNMGGMKGFSIAMKQIGNTLSQIVTALFAPLIQGLKMLLDKAVSHFSGLKEDVKNDKVASLNDNDALDALVNENGSFRPSNTLALG